MHADGQGSRSLSRWNLCSLWFWQLACKACPSVMVALCSIMIWNEFKTQNSSYRWLYCKSITWDSVDFISYGCGWSFRIAKNEYKFLPEYFRRCNIWDRIGIIFWIDWTPKTFPRIRTWWRYFDQPRWFYRLNFLACIWLTIYSIEGANYLMVCCFNRLCNWYRWVIFEIVDLWKQ